GAAYIYVRSDTGWILEEKINIDAYAYSVSLDGDTAIISSLRTEESFASIYTRSENGWIEDAKISPYRHIGTFITPSSVSINGNIAVIGYYSLDDTYIFVRSEREWMPQAQLRVSGRTKGDRFGTAVSVSGNTIIIGANGDDDQGTDSGSAWIYDLSGYKLLPE
ncbi:MAG: hypothetical protein D3923_08600, partial [Candidatus Electrothrix sp. AR3]|nr:hypothetical protein [Candidatus Electrothrix sp. AR3]